MLIHDIALTMVPDIGAVRAKKLIEEFGSAEEVMKKAAPEDVARIAQTSNIIAAKIVAKMKHNDIFIAADNEIKFIERNKIDVIKFDDDRYPKRLKECYDAPVILYKKGEIELEQKNIIAIVGTRHITSYGMDMCDYIVRGIAQLVPDAVIVSGLAHGVDITAEKAALKYGLKTISVVANNLKEVTPEANRAMLTRLIDDGGAVVTEMNTFHKTQKNSFLQRNRIIAGLSQGTLVIESGVVGGALNTVHCAIDYYREAMAVPGRITDKYSVGCNNLIRTQAAGMVMSAEDVINQLQWSVENMTMEEKSEKKEDKLELTDDQKKVYDALDTMKFIPFDSILYKTGYSVGQLSLILLQLELKDLVRARGVNYIKI